MSSPNNRASKHLFTWASIALFFSAIVIIFLTHEDYGISFDEPLHLRYGEIVADYYSSFFRETNHLKYTNMNLYGSAFDLPLHMLINIPTNKKIDPINASHLFTAIVGMAGVIGTWKLARFFRSERAAFLAATLLLVHPSFSGHMFNNPKDIPFAVGYTWSVYFLIRSLNLFPKLPFKQILRLAIVIGLTMGVRVGGVFLLGYLWLAGLCFIASPNYFSGTDSSTIPLPQRVMKSLLPVTVTSIIAYAVMLAVWPYAQLNPLTHPVKVLIGSMQFEWNNPVLFNGNYYPSTQLPIGYIPGYFLVKTPELILICIGLGLYFCLDFLTTKRYRTEKPLFLRYIFLVISIIIPVNVAIWTRAVLYDEIRHFLFIVPLISVVAGLTLDKLFDLSKAWGRLLRWATFVSLAALFVFQVYNLGSLYPYQYIYYNQLTGGVKGAQNRFELDYWGVSFQEAIRSFLPLVDSPGSSNHSPKYTVLICGPNMVADYYLPRNFRQVDSLGEADYYISFTRFNCDKNLQGKMLVTVERMGIPLAVIKNLRLPEQP